MTREAGRPAEKLVILSSALQLTIFVKFQEGDSVFEASKVDRQDTA